MYNIRKQIKNVKTKSIFLLAHQHSPSTMEVYKTIQVNLSFTGQKHFYQMALGLKGYRNDGAHYIFNLY